MRSIILTALILAALLSAIWPTSWSSSTTHAQGGSPVQCCGKKPQFSDPAYSSVFTGQVAVATSFSGYALEVIDLKNQSTAPLNTNYAPPIYHGPAGAEWTRSRLGNIFGLTLDNQGNIYTTATTAYNGDFFPAGATGGEIYKIDGVTGAISVFKTLPNTGHVGLGNINYSCAHQNFYVSNIDDGMIYRLDTSGNILSTWDHGANLGTATPSSTAIPDDPTKPFTPLGRRIWGIQENPNDGRLYYAVWWEDSSANNASQNNEVWSVGLAANGNFVGSAKLEVSLPLSNGSTMPIPDISFGPTGTMLLAERTMSDETTTNAHNSRVLEYVPGTTWTLPNPSKFQGGTLAPNSAAGGVDYDFGSGGLVWATFDALHLVTPDNIYGLEGLPVAGGNATNSILIDYDGNIIGQNKTQIGDVEIPCPPAVVSSSCKAEFAATTSCPGQATTFTDLSSGASSWNWNFGDSSSPSNQQHPTHVYATAGSYSVTLSVNGGACTVTHTVNVSPAPPPPIITGPATTCQSGTYSIPPQSGAISWSVTNGTPASGTGTSINVTWNPTGIGLVAVTVANPETCCKTTAQLIVRPCDTASACCEGMNVNAVLKDFVAIGGGVYTFTPTLTAGPNNITHVSATIISTSLTFSSNCGVNGPANSYVTSATSPAGFSSSLPVPFSRDVTWTASASSGVNLSGGIAFPFNIQFPAPPSSSICKDTLSFCVKYTFTDANCRTCEIIRCYGPFTRGGGSPLLPSS